MNSIKDALWQDYNDISERINGGNIEKTENFKVLLEQKDNIRNELIKMEQISQERYLTDLKIESENKRDRIRNIITIGTFIITTVFSGCVISKTFKFDQVSTVTSTLGRNILNGVVPKMLKR